MMSFELDADPRVVYADIIALPRHQSDRHPHMSLHDRAAQFAPFAALIGYDEMVGEEARMTDRQIAPGESELEELNLKFRILSEQLNAKQRPEISVLVFVPDSRKTGGRYENITGCARRLDPVEKKLFLLGKGTPAGRIILDMDRILDLSFSGDP